MNAAATTVAPLAPLIGQRWLVVGAAGMLGQDMVAAATEAGAKVRGVDLPEIDITDVASVRKVLDAGYDVVVNCAAWTAVDDAEEKEALAFQVNAVGPANLARAAAKTGARLVQISTDYVFAGNSTEPYGETEAIAPQGAYGRTKAAGEWAVAANTDNYLIVRTAWLYGAGGPNFPKTMQRLAVDREILTVVDDQIGQPTWTKDLADLIVRLVAAQAPAGIYHGTSQGAVNWNGFAKAIMTAIGSTTQVDPISSAAFAAKAPRPSYSVLDHSTLRAARVEPIGPWEERWQTAAPEVLGSEIAGQARNDG
jgi:dTDP-4-dehydrorhamnose reductase